LENVNAKGKIVVSESGIKNADDIKFLRKSGATAFLIGCAIMSADDVESKMNEFTQIEKLER
jgi:indole-3-glycerol phosphate synthase